MVKENYGDLGGVWTYMSIESNPYTCLIHLDHMNVTLSYYSFLKMLGREKGKH